MRGNPFSVSQSLPPSVLPDISPTRGESGNPLASRIKSEIISRLVPLLARTATTAVIATNAARSSPPSWGRCPAGQRGALSRHFSVLILEASAISPSSGPSGHLLPASGAKGRVKP